MRHRVETCISLASFFIFVALIGVVVYSWSTLLQLLR